MAKPRRPLAELRALQRAIDLYTGRRFIREAIPRFPNPVARELRGVIGRLRPPL